MPTNGYVAVHLSLLPVMLAANVWIFLGSAAFTGLGVYTYYSGRKQLLERRQEIMRSGSRFGIAARKASLVGMSALLVGIGAYRLVN